MYSTLAIQPSCITTRSAAPALVVGSPLPSVSAAAPAVPVRNPRREIMCSFMAVLPYPLAPHSRLRLRFHLVDVSSRSGATEGAGRAAPSPVLDTQLVIPRGSDDKVAFPARPPCGGTTFASGRRSLARGSWPTQPDH